MKNYRPGTEGQSKGKAHGGGNQREGGAPGQPHGKKNVAMKPHYGTQGQRKSGGGSSYR